MIVTSIKGAKAGQDKPRKPSIAKDSVASTSTAKLLYILSEGEIAGLVDGGRSIYLDGTPLLDDAGNSNFEGVTWDFRTGTNEQDYIKGFPDVANETPVNVELRSDNPWIKAFTDTQLSAVRVRFKWNRLSKTNPENGDVKGYKIQYAIDLQTNGGAYVEVLNTKIEDKTSAGYERTHRIDLPRSTTGWQIRVRRITPNDSSEYVQDTMLIDAVAEVIDVKLRYPNTALLGLQYNAETFSGIAKMEARIRGMIIRVPSNYDAVARTYTGIWDGTFKDAYTDNPAWIYFDLCTQWRYGLGDRLDITMIDKWSLYALGQYCDQMVSDGQGGLEPRFTCNVYLQKQVDAYQVLQNIGGIFRAMSYWNGERIVLDADVPQDPVYTFSRANVIDGNFEYTGTRARDRHTLAKVAWDNPLNRFETEYEYIRDEKAMAKFGVKVLDLSAFGCTSQAQAQRAGLWALKTEQLETRQVSFGVGLDGFIPSVGNIINISDELFAGRANGGRVSAVSDAQYVVTLDRDVVANAGDVLIVNGGNGKSERRTIKTVAGRKITLNVAFAAAETENVWAIETADLKLMRFRVLSIGKSDETTFAVTAIQHEPQKFPAIDFGTDVKPTDITIVNPDVVDAPASVTITSRHRVVQGQTIATLIISWAQVKDAVAYDVEWRKDDGTWVKVPRTGNVSVEIEGVYSGNYLARVRSVSAFDVQSQPTVSMLTEVQGKIGLPPTIVGLTATGILFGMEIKWGFTSGSGDAAYTEIETGSAPNTNVKLLGQYSYPNNTHTVTGLQGNLSQSYRARLVDKLGFKSNWSSWVTGTTDASADKIMDLIQGQIDESALDQALRSEIGKIDINKTILDDLGVDLNAKLAETKVSVSAAQADLTTAKSNIVTALNKADTALANANTNKINLAAVNEAVSKNKTDVDLSISTLTNKDISLTNLYTALKSEYDTNKAKVVLDLKTLTDKDTALASLITTLDSDYKGNKATVSNSLATLTNKDTALTNSLNSLTTTVGNNTTDISNEITARSNADSALSTRITSNTTKTDNALSRISTAETAIATNTQSIATAKTELKAEFTAFNSVQDTRNDNQPPEWYWANYPAQTAKEFKRAATVGITSTGTYVYVETLVKWKDPSGGAIVQMGYDNTGDVYSRKSISSTTWGEWIKQEDVIGSAAKVAEAKAALDGRINSTNAAISSEATTRASADSALTTKVNAATSKADNALARITTAENTISDTTQAIATTKTELRSEFTINENLFSIADCIRGFESSGDIRASTPNHQTMQTLMPIAGNKPIVMQTWNPNKVNTGNSNRIAFFTADKTYIESTSSTANLLGNSYHIRTINPPSNARWIRIGVIVGSSDIDTSISIKVEEGVATAWKASSIDTINNVAAIRNEELTRANENSVLSGLINTVSATAGTNKSAIQNLQNTTASQTDAIASTKESILASTGGVNLLVLNRMKGGYYSSDGTVNDASVDMLDPNYYRISGGDRLVFRLLRHEGATGVSGRVIYYNGARNVIGSQESHRRNEFKAVYLTAPEGSVYFRHCIIGVGIKAMLERGNSASAWEQSPYDNYAAIEEEKTVRANVDGQLLAQYTLKLDVGGRISGFGLASSATQSEFAINADKFWIAPPTGTSRGKSPFMVLTSPQTINGTVVPAGTYMTAAFIHEGAIDLAKINTATIINLSALSADLGSVTAGSININNKFMVDRNGNMTAVGGTFSGTIAADTIDVDTLKRSAWMPSWDIYYSTSTFVDNPANFDKSYPVSHPSRGSIDVQWSDTGSNAMMRMLFEMKVTASKDINVTQKGVRVDDVLELYVNGTQVAINNGYNTITVPLKKGLNTVNYLLKNNSSSTPMGLILAGNFVDNTVVKFA
jgi:predicted phage tail protein/Fe2+ transport system protein FeoA